MTEKRISVQEFIKKYNGMTSEVSKETYLRSVVKSNTYVEYATKVACANQILEASCFDKKGNLKFDSCKKYLFYIWMIFNFYTLIDIDSKKMMEEYDKLEKYDLISPIVALMPKRDLNMFDTVLKMRQDDLISNHCGLENYLDKTLKSVRSNYSKGLSQVLAVLTKTLGDLDEDKIVDMLSAIAKSEGVSR